MTTIVLTILGILLAAAAALMLVFYGSGAFFSGSIGARANSYENAGSNVASAVALARADGFDVDSLSSLSQLRSSSDPDRDYLRREPAVPDGLGFAIVTDAGAKFLSIGIGGEEREDVCRRINRNVGGTALVLTSMRGERGCMGQAGSFLYFARL